MIEIRLIPGDDRVDVELVIKSLGGIGGLPRCALLAVTCWRDDQWAIRLWNGTEWTAPAAAEADLSKSQLRCIIGGRGE